MLVFIVPLQSPKVSKSWDRVSKLANRTIASLANQSDPRFQIFLVCNERPIGLPSFPQLNVIECDLAPPPNVHLEREKDKWVKIRIGLAAARAYAPAHFMLVDADDCVSRDLARVCAAQPSANGWFMDRGYVHREGASWLLLQENFHHICGTSAILHCDVEDLPEGQCDDSRTITRFGHSVIADEMRRIGRPLSPLPFVGSVYMTGTSENHSGFTYRPFDSIRRFAREVSRYRLLTPSLRAAYGLRELS